MKRYLPLALGLIILVLLNLSIIKQQRLIATGKSIFVQLKPVDPRSLIQGDYMVLDYELHWESNYEDDDSDAEQDYNDYSADRLLFHSQHKTIKVSLNEQAVVIKSEAATATELAANQHWLEVKSNDGVSFYPASNTFLFAEGLAYCYDQAEFAEFKVAADGSVLLYRLHAEDLTPLNCESKARNIKEKLWKLSS